MITMKVELLTKDGKPLGFVEIPDEVVSAANRVCTWLSGQLGTHGEVQSICGVMLAPPPASKMPLDTEPPLPLDKGRSPLRKFWWNRDE
jgi:hypothetical protein